MIKVLFVVISVWDANTGKVLREMEEQQASYVTIEACRRAAVQRAHGLTAHYLAHGYANAFTNVDCEWRNGFPMDPA